MLGSFSPMGGTQPRVRGRTCRSHYLRKAIRQSRVALAWPAPLVRSERRLCLQLPEKGLGSGQPAINYDPGLAAWTCQFPGVLCFVAVRKRAPPDWFLEVPRVLCHSSVSLTIQLKFHSAQGRQGWTEAARGLAQEVPGGPATGPCPITPTQSWNVFDFSSQAYMCLPSDTMLAVILARKHVWCSHPIGGGRGALMERNFRPTRNKKKKVSDYYTQHPGSAMGNSKYSQSALFLYGTF